MIPEFRLRRAELHVTTAAGELVSAGHTLGLMREIFTEIAAEPNTRQALEQNLIAKLQAARTNIDMALHVMRVQP